MNKFISEMCKTMGIPESHKLNCSQTQGTIIDDSKIGFCLTLPDGTAVEIYTPESDNDATGEGFAYIPAYDCESPDMCAEDLGCWVEDSINCCKRIDAFYASLANSATTLNSALDPTVSNRVKTVFRAAQEGVDLPVGFRYRAFRTVDDLIIGTLEYTSTKLGATQWVAKSSLIVDTSDEDMNKDEWNFEPNYNPQSEGHLIYHRPGRFIDIEQGMYGFSSEGDTPEQRDKKAAYWLAGLLSDMIDSMLENPPARCYEHFLADGIAEIKKSNLEKMSTPGIMRLVTKGYLDPEKVLKAKPTLAKDLVQKGLITPEIVARRVPERILWLVQQGYITADYAVKVDPTIKDKLVRKGLYGTSENVPDEPTAIMDAVAAGTITPVDAYRKNPKLLQEMVERSLVTPQEAYKLDASIVTWLLLNHYIGKAEAKKIKPDVEKYITRKYKDVNLDDLDASRGDDVNKLDALKKKFAEYKKAAGKADAAADDAQSTILKKARAIRKAAGLNSSLRLNSSETEESETPTTEGDAEYGEGYEMLANTTAEGPGFVAEVMLPEDNFDGIVIPGATEEEAKEILTQMLLANDGTFVDWKKVPCIQTFKSENPEGNFVVLN